MERALKQIIFSWVVIGAIVLLLLGGGISFMTSATLYCVADYFFIAAAILFLIKFIPWVLQSREAKKKRIIIIAIFITSFVTIGALYGNHYINRSEKNLPSTDVAQKKKIPPAYKFQPELSPLLLAKITMSQKQIVSTDPQSPYGLEVILQTDTLIGPVAFIIEFSGEIGKGDAGFVSSSRYDKVNSGLIKEHHNMFGFKWESPAFTPDKPIRVTIFSKNAVKVIRYEKVPYTWP